MPTVLPEGMCSSTSVRALSFAWRKYLKVTPSKSTEPSFTSVTGSAGLASVGSSVSTSVRRFMASMDMVSMT